jgi:two-component system, OmpR family, sensor histidine kinase KdpD
MNDTPSSVPKQDARAGKADGAAGDTAGGARWPHYAAALGVTAACTVLAALIYPWLDRANLIMVYLLGTTIAALRLGRGPAALTAVLNVLVFDYFFVPPHYTLAVADIQYLVTFAVMLIVALVIATLVASVRAQTHAADSARFAAEKEALRNTLLAAISHDLRTPLTTIAGAGSMLADTSLQLDAATRTRLATSIDVKAREMSALISNVLDLMRLESGAIALRCDWQTVDELVGSALGRCGDALKAHLVVVALPPDLPPVHVDAPLVTQLLCNLFENAAKHTPPGTRVVISAFADPHAVTVVIADTGPGLPDGDPERWFQKFQRGHDEEGGGGAGLGLAICRVIARAHGGEIRACNAPEGGALFSFTLSTDGPAP